MTEVAVELDYRRPLASVPLRRFLEAHAIPGLETYDSGAREHVRLVPAPSGPALVRVILPEGTESVSARVRLADPGDLGGVLTRVRRWLDLDADPATIDAALSGDPLLAPCVEANPGLRVPGTVDGGELALLSVLGQQVSLRAARTFASRLVAAFGSIHDDALRSFPPAATILEIGAEQLRSTIGVTGARARSLHAVAGALADGLVLDRDADRYAARAALLRLPGIGAWTAEYVALRALADPDAYPSGDLVLRRALGLRTAGEAEARAAGWRPWRGYALVHLWTREVFS